MYTLFDWFPGNVRNGVPSAACQIVALPPTAFRVTDLDLRDPHIIVPVSFLCLAVTDAPLKLTSPLGRLLNPFVRI